MPPPPVSLRVPLSRDENETYPSNASPTACSSTGVGVKTDARSSHVVVAGSYANVARAWSGRAGENVAEYVGGIGRRVLRRDTREDVAESVACTKLKPHVVVPAALVL